MSNLLNPVFRQIAFKGKNKTTENTDVFNASATGSGDTACALVSKKMAATEVGTDSSLAFELCFFLTRALKPDM